jgi:hypothetical protein
VQRVLDDRLDRSEAGAAGDEDDRLVRFLAQEERAERTFEAKDLATSVFVEELVGEVPAGDVANVQLEQRVVVRWRRKGKAAAAAVLQQEIDVLPGQILEPLVRRQLDLDDRHIRRGLVDRFDAAGKLPDLDVAGAANFPDLEHEIGQRLRAAEESEPLLLLDFGQRRRLMRSVVDAPLEDLAFARAAGAVAATVREHQIRGHRRCENGVPVLARKRNAAGVYGNLVWHGDDADSKSPAPCAGAKDAGVIRVLMIGCGDVALRTARLLHPKVRLYGLTRRVEDVAKLRAHGIVPIIGDLDRLASLGRLRAAPHAVLHFAPPPSDGRDDSRNAKLVAALARARSIPQRFVYISTSGVYGDCAGARIGETRPRRAGTPRARRRVAARTAFAIGPSATACRCRSCACPASTPRRACRSIASGKARRRSTPTTTSTRITCTPTISRAPLSPRCSARSPIARTTFATTPR